MIIYPPLELLNYGEHTSTDMFCCPVCVMPTLEKNVGVRTELAGGGYM